MEATEEELWRVCPQLPSDFEPFGKRLRHQDEPDCSSCRWYQPLLRAGALAWGTCVNPQSPRAGLLTFRGQGCQYFEQDQEPTNDDSRRSRVDFKDSIENMVREALGAFTRLEVAKVNDPDTRIQNWIEHWECKISEILEIQLYLLFAHTGSETDFDLGKAAQEMILETKRHTKRFWEVAQRSIARSKKRDVSSIRLPDTPRLGDEFWRKVDLALAQAVAQKEKL